MGETKKVYRKESLHTAGGPTGYECFATHFFGLAPDIKKCLRQEQELPIKLCVDHFVMHMELFPIFT
jgi:hypothetical protein